MSTKNLFISGCIIILIFIISAFIYRQKTTKPNSDMEYPVTEKPVTTDIVRPKLKKNTDTDNKSPNDYYRTIVDNNIFRPLGWRPPKKEPEYTLIGTKSYSHSDITEAIILERRSKKLKTVKVGENLGNVTVKEIKPRQVILDDKGKEIKLELSSQKYLK